MLGSLAVPAGVSGVVAAGGCFVAGGAPPGAGAFGLEVPGVDPLADDVLCFCVPLLPGAVVVSTCPVAGVAPGSGVGAVGAGVVAGSGGGGGAGSGAGVASASLAGGAAGSGATVAAISSVTVSAAAEAGMHHASASITKTPAHAPRRPMNDPTGPLVVNRHPFAVHCDAQRLYLAHDPCVTVFVCYRASAVLPRTLLLTGYRVPNP